MPVFTWEGRTRQGTTKKGVMEAASEAAVMAQLRAQAIMPVAVKPKAKDLLEGFALLRAGPIKTRTSCIFTRQFATMIDAGLPLVQCLDILANQQTNKALRGDHSRPSRPTSSRARPSPTRSRKHPKPFDDALREPGRAPARSAASSTRS